jgi:molybdate transport system ATP-binding protein
VLSLDLHYTRDGFALRARADIGGGVTGIFGPSGSGKSTLLALIAGLLRPQVGSLRIDDDVLIDSSRKVFVPAWRRHVGIVFQDGQLFPHMSVRRNLLYGYERLAAGERRFHLDAVTQLLEIGPLLERRPALLSGGERQRVALGRALLYSPRVLLLDEPLSSLDERLKLQILPFLKRLKEETRVPMLYVSHARSEIDYLADRVLTMEAGALADAQRA